MVAIRRFVRAGKEVGREEMGGQIEISLARRSRAVGSYFEEGGGRVRVEVVG